MRAMLAKLDVARRKLETAMELFLRDKDPVSVQFRACGGADLIGSIAGSAGA
jgi:hypothetical protein